MVKLSCVIVGVAGSAFSVRVDESDWVDDLKDAIKTKNSQTITCDAKDLQLFLAKKEGAWLPDDDPAAQQLEEGNTDDDEIKKMLGGEQMKATKTLQHWLFEKNKMPPPSTDQIHVLVVVSGWDSSAEETRKPKLTSLAMMLKTCVVVGDLPQEGAFLNLFEWTDDDCGKVMDIKVIDDIVHFTGSKFYVRKEILCVLENFKKIYQHEFDTGELVNMQMVLMGSPGTGKSCILALICFYIAVHYGRPVVWFRKVIGGLYTMTATRLFYQGKYYEWDDDNGKIFERLYDAMKPSGIDLTKCWFCLDGMEYREVLEKNWFNRYKLLATSGQCPPKSEAMQFTAMCLVPYWKQTDLEDFGLKHMHMQESEVNARFFVAGGSLREFLSGNVIVTVKTALDCIEKPDDAGNLLTPYGLGSNKQIDRIRMRGVRDRNNAEDYMYGSWTNCVTSKLVLQHMAAMMKPNFFDKLMGIAKGMNDDRLEGVALEGYFHSSVRHQRSIQVQYCKYDNVDRRTVQDWESIMDEEVGSIKVNEPSLAKCEGGNRMECVAVMERWAANPSEMNYWIPATSLCETIDAVARWTISDGVVRFCFLQLTKATTHKCDAAILWELAQPFVDKQLPVCYIALLPDDPDEDKRRTFRLNPAVITQKKVLDHIRLYVARFEVTPCHESINTTSS